MFSYLMLNIFMLNLWNNFMLDFYIFLMLLNLFRLFHFLYLFLLRLFNFFFNWSIARSFIFHFSLLFTTLWSFLDWLFELFRYISNSSPIFSNFFLLSSHFNEKSSSHNFFIETISDKVDGINFCFKYDLERSRIIFLDLDKVKLRECFFDVLFYSVEITFYEV